MWTCAKCGQRFYNTNQSHSCGRHTVDDFLKGKSDGAIALFHLFLSEYRKIGEFELHPVKTRVALLTQMRFCAINRVGEDFIDVHLVLTKPYRNACCHKIENFANRFYVPHVRIHGQGDITPPVRKLMRLAYDVGDRKHVQGARKKKG